MSPRILLVEDEQTIAESVAYTLRGEGFEVESVPSGEAALDLAAASEFDLLVLDLMLPGLSGLEVCRRMRSASNAVPILMLTARTAEVDRVVGLEAGADDYIVKPFSMPEFVARVRAMLRRRELDREGSDGVSRVGGLELDPSRHTATVDGRDVQLTNSEFRLLRTLAERPGQVYSRRELMQRLWDSTYVGDERAADVHVANLRRKVEADPQNPVRILTVRGAGYVLAEV